MNYLPMLDKIWNDYEFQKKSLALVKRTVIYNAQHSENIVTPKLLLKAGLSDVSVEMIDRDSLSAKESLQGFVVLSIWVVFERLLIEFLQKLIATDVAIVVDNSTRQMLIEQVRNDVERWKPDMMLDMVKPVITADTVGTLKKIKRHRDWIAHRNPAATPEKIDPRTAYELVREAARQIEQSQSIIL